MGPLALLLTLTSAAAASVEPHVIGAFASYTDTHDAFGSYQGEIDAFGSYDSDIDAFASEG